MTGRDINGDIPAGSPSVKVGICLDFPIEDVKQSFLDACRLAFDIGLHRDFKYLGTTTWRALVDAIGVLIGVIDSDFRASGIDLLCISIQCLMEF